MSLTRGLFGAAGSAFILAAIALIMPLVFFAVGWFINETGEFQREFEIQFLRKHLILPILFCTVMGACAGWATFAPEGRHSFVASLLAVLLGSLLIWNVLSLFISQKPSKKEDRPSITLSQALVLLPPPMVVAAILARRRARIQSLATRTAQSL